MKITYENRPDDIAIYGQLLYTKSPTVKQHRTKALKYAVLLSAIIGLVLYFTGAEDMTLYFWVGLSIIWLISIPFTHRRRYIKNMIKTYGDDTHKNLFGKHELIINESGLTDEIENGVNKTGWDEIEHIETSDEVVYIFVKNSLAYFILKSNITEGSFEQFSKQIGRYKNK